PDRPVRAACDNEPDNPALRTPDHNLKRVAMSIFEKRIDEVVFADVEELVKGRYPEGPNLEYKSAFHEEKWPDEFMDTVAALANSGGGLLLYGVTEEHDYPTGIPGCKLPNSVRLTMQQKSNGLRPHVPVGVQVIPVAASGGK